MRRRLASAVLAGLGIAALSLAVESAMLPGQLLLVSTDASVSASVPTVAERLIIRHDCWTGSAPLDMAGVIPGHVVVTMADGTTRYGGSRLVGQSLDQLFADADHRLTVHGFCR